MSAPEVLNVGLAAVTAVLGLRVLWRGRRLRKLEKQLEAMSERP